MPCNKGCCKAYFIPLELAFARTLHQFQGQEAGQKKNIKCIICDPGSRDFEVLNPGTAYTALSRASELGDDKGYGSSIYFCGPNICHSRLTNMTSMKPKLTKSNKNNKDNQHYKKVKLRRKWVNHLEKNITDESVSNQALTKMYKGLNKKVITQRKLDTIIQFHRSCQKSSE